MSVRLRPGADVVALRGRAANVVASPSTSARSRVGCSGPTTEFSVRIRHQAVALWIVAALTVLAALAVFGQALGPPHVPGVG